LPAGCGVGAVCDIVGAGVVLIAGVAVLPGGLFKGAPTAISQRCPGLPCSGLRPLASLFVVVTAVGAAGVVVIIFCVLVSAIGAAGMLIVVVLLVVSEVLVSTLSESWQEAKANASRAILKSLVIIKDWEINWLKVL
jgi:hypothetical protein